MKTVTSLHGAVTTTTYSSPTVTVASTNNGGLQRWTKTTTDGLGRVVKTETGENATVHSVVDTEYEPCACSPIGKVKRTTRPYKSGEQVSWITYGYDGLGRTRTVTQQDGSVTNYTYQGATTIVQDPASKRKQMQHDAFGNLKYVWEPSPEGEEYQSQ